MFRPIAHCFLELSKALAYTFSTRQAAIIQLRIADLEHRYGISLTTSDLFLSELRNVAVPELEDIQALLADIQTATTQLDWYKRVNQEALQRIVDKQPLVTRGQPPRSRSSAAEAARLWDSELLACVNQLRCAVCTALAEDGPTSMPRRTSLLAQQLFRTERLNISEAALRAVATDDSVALGNALCQVHDKDSNRSDDDRTLLVRALLQLTIPHRSFRCCALLTLRSAPPPASRTGDQVKDDADYLHRLIGQVGRQRIGDAPDRLNQMLQSLPEGGRWMFLHADAFGRLPLHYAASYGLDCVCRTILASMVAWGWPASRRRQVVFARDVGGETPLDLAVKLGYATAAQALLEEEKEAASLPQHFAGDDGLPGPLLFTAIQAGFEDVFFILLSAGPRLHHYRNDKGETAVYVAARHGHAAMVRALLLAAVDPNLAETVRGWTPLMIAAIQGHHEVLEVLVQATVDQDTRDHDRGWTALDHAAYKGYPAMMKMLRRQSTSRSYFGPQGFCQSENRVLPTVASPWLDNKTSHPQSYIFVHPGTLDVYEEVAVVDISPYRAEVAPAAVPETSLFLEISSLEPLQQQEQAPISPPCVSQLPILDDWSNRPWGFTTRDASNAKVVFRLFTALATRGDGPIGTAIALLSSLRRVLGPGRESLIRHHTIPFLGPRGNLVGTVTFTFMVAEAPATLRPSPTAPQQLKRSNSTLIGAHRGKSETVTSFLHAYLTALQASAKTASSTRTCRWGKIHFRYIALVQQSELRYLSMLLISIARLK